MWNKRKARSNNEEERLLAFAKKVMWEPIKDKCTIFSNDNSRKFGFEEIFQKGVKEIFYYLSFREKVELFPFFLSNVIQIRKSTKGLEKDPERNLIESEELKEIEEYARKLGVSSLGYCKVDRDDIFEGFGIIYDHAIVFNAEMDKEKISKAPSFPTLKMIYKTYAATGVIANKLAKRLRKMGFGAHAGPGLGGLTIYPVLAERAGIGTFGRHGLIITPENGPRHRLGVVYTNITNLPKTKREDFSWVKEFYMKCSICIRTCPAQAIYEQPIATKGKYITYIDNVKCGDFFAKNYACGICIKVCPFNSVGYETIKRSMIKAKNNGKHR
jgi:ferredoxin